MRTRYSTEQIEQAHSLKTSHTRKQIAKKLKLTLSGVNYLLTKTPETVTWKTAPTETQTSWQVREEAELGQAVRVLFRHIAMMLK